MSGTSIERVSEAGPRVPRTRLDRIAEWYRSSPVGTWGMVVINAVLQGAGIVLAFSLGFNVPMIKFVLTAVTGLSLIWRRRWPLGIVIVNNVALMIKMIKSDSAEFLLPLLVAVYTLIAIASVRQRLLGIATTMVFMFIPYLASINGPLPGLMKERVPLSDFMQEAGFLIVVVTVASITRSRRESLEHGDAQLASHTAEQQLVVQRDAARYQARVAAELHDSVGHSLTAIIALSEGLQGASGIPDVDEAIDLVNSLARDGLADTRNAVASLQSSPAILDDFGSGALTSSRPMIATGDRHQCGPHRDRSTPQRHRRGPGTRRTRLHRRPGGPHQRHAARRGRHARRRLPGPHRLIHPDHRVRRRTRHDPCRLLAGLPRAVHRSRTDQPGLRDPRARRCA